MTTAPYDPVSDGAARPPDEFLARNAAWLVPVFGLIALHLSHPLVWHRGLPGWWFPPVGIGLVLVAWLGRRGAVLVAADVLLVAAQLWLTGGPMPWGEGWAAVAGAVWDAVLLGAEVGVGWYMYQQVACGSRSLGDPRSATLFLITVPSLVGAVFASLRAVAVWLFPPDEEMYFLQLLGTYWLSHALSVLTVAPPLLASLTPWLVRHRLAYPEPPGEASELDRPRKLARGDVIEILGLAFGMAVMGLLQAFIHRDRELADWQLWGLPLLVIVWASLRQGLRGGTIVASSAVALTLVIFGFIDSLPPDPFWQANLLAQCSTALLVASAANWIRLSEARYRQVVTRIPVVLYSARVVQRSPDGRTPPLAELTFVSPAARLMLGVEPDELLGDYRHWLARVHPEDQEIVLAALTQLGRQKHPVTCEYRLAPAEMMVGAPPRSALRALRAALGAAYGSRVISLQPPSRRQRCVRDTLAPLVGPTGLLEGWDGVLSDITEQRLLADDLRRTTSLFHALVANLPAGVFFVQGEAGQPILVNARARQLLGQREDTSAGLDRLVQVYHLCRPDGTPYPTDELPVVGALRYGQTSMRDDIVVHRPDGHRMPLVTWAAPIDLGGEGTHDAAVWVLEDLTQLQKAEAARRESEARLRTLIEVMAEGVVVLDDAGLIVDHNPAAATILGQTGPALRGRSAVDPSWNYRREDGTPLPPAETPAGLCLQTAQPVRDVVLGVPVPPRGDLRWLLVNSVPLSESRAARVVVTFADITATRQAMDVVRASEEKYRVLVETLPLMLVQFDRQGRVTYMNPEARTATGYALEDLLDGWGAIVLPEDLQQARDLHAAALAGRTARSEVRFRVKDGSEKVGYVLVEPREQAGQIVGSTGLIVDMTRERHLELELQRSQRLELIGRLSSGIAHDFNNLLTVVLALAELAQGNLPSDHPVQDDLRRIAYAGEQAANLAHQLLAFSKNRKVMPHPLDLNRVARRTLELLRATLPRAIHIEAELADADLVVEADEMQLQQVLMNLCLNARDAMPEGGRLLVRTEAGPGPDGLPRGVRLTVEDSGQGIPQAMQGKIFDAFFSTKERGTGLGLAMVQQIVESFGGRVDVESRPGEGARFEVWLPATTAAVPGGQEVSTP